MVCMFVRLGVLIGLGLVVEVVWSSGLSLALTSFCFKGLPCRLS